MLFIKNLPDDITVEGVKALSKDIQNVELRMSARSGGQNRGFVFTFDLCNAYGQVG